MMILLNAIYDSYLMYIDEYEYTAFSLMSHYSHYIFMSFGVLIAIGLLVKSKVARYLILLSVYLPLFGALYYLLVYGTMQGVPTYMFILGIGFYILNIYLLSHNDILKVYNIKSLKSEIVFYIFISLVFYIFFTLYIKNMTDDFDNEALFEHNTSIEKGNQ